MYNINLKIMKKLLVISAAVGLALLTSCRSDNDNESEQLTLKGNWRPDKIVSTTTTGGTSTTTTVVTDACQQKGRIMFTTDTSGKINYYDNVNGTCSLLFDLDMTYSYNPGTKDFSITTNGNKMDGAVTMLTSTNMVVYYVDKSNPDSTNRVEISATKVAN